MSIGRHIINRCLRSGQKLPGPRRSTNYGRLGNDKYLPQANTETFVVGQIESRNLVDNIDELVEAMRKSRWHQWNLTKNGVDGVVIGPYDLSGSYELPGNIDHPTVVEAIQISIDKCREAGIYVGVGMGIAMDSLPTTQTIFTVKGGILPMGGTVGHKGAGAHWAMVGTLYRVTISTWCSLPIIYTPKSVVPKAHNLRKISAYPGLAYHNPVHVANRLAFLDHLSHGRLNVCFALARSQPT